jgi:hypothetical protein
VGTALKHVIWLIVAVAVLTSGCRGGDGESAPSATIAEYFEQLQQAGSGAPSSLLDGCEDLDPLYGLDVGAYSDEVRDETLRFHTCMHRLLAFQVEELQKIRPPDAAVQAHEDWVESIQSAVDEAAEDIAMLEQVRTSDDYFEYLERSTDDLDLDPADPECWALEDLALQHDVEIDMGCNERS